ncbi:MAG TPA: helix-turn-helix domain-containing protein [Anaerolineaceae bacterium]|nr:helix-turn-helix domain-containing protein [Anaerolineaceae bacterium]
METFTREALFVDVGTRLKQLREERHTSMRALAKASNLSANALSMIERGLTSPSVSTLSKLAGALEVPITAFFRREPERQNIVFRPLSDRKQVPLKSGLWEDLGGDAFSERMEAFNLSLDAGGNSGQHAMMHSGCEFVLIVSGQLDYEVEEKCYHMQAGDSLLFTANLKHRWSNPGPGATNATIVIASFVNGDRPGEYHLAVRDQDEIN